MRDMTLTTLVVVGCGEKKHPLPVLPKTDDVVKSAAVVASSTIFWRKSFSLNVAKIHRVAQ